jgi:hypothetical protein
MFITFSFRIIVLSIGYYASVGGEDTSQAKDFGIGGVTSWPNGGLDSLLLDHDLKLPILSFTLPTDTLPGVASEHGPVSFRTECLIPWTVGKPFGLELGWQRFIIDEHLVCDSS